MQQCPMGEIHQEKRKEESDLGLGLMRGEKKKKKTPGSPILTKIQHIHPSASSTRETLGTLFTENGFYKQLYSEEGFLTSSTLFPSQWLSLCPLKQTNKKCPLLLKMSPLFHFDLVPFGYKPSGSRPNGQLLHRALARQGTWISVQEACRDLYVSATSCPAFPP